MNATAYFIKGRAQALAYEAIRFPATAEVALAWLDRAVDAALKTGQGSLELAFELECIIDRIKDHYRYRAACEHFALAGQSMDALPLWAGEGEV
jgi:hypothetical protein